MEADPREDLNIIIVIVLKNKFFRTTLPTSGDKSGMGESRSSIQATRPRKYAGTKNEGHIIQDGKFVPTSKVDNAVISGTVKNNETVNNNLRIASLNIDTGLFNKEERLINTIGEHELDILVCLKLT